MTRDIITTIIGPTAVGKTRIAIEVCRRVSGEIISADSRQVYKYLDIGTAKPTGQERQAARFHLIDFIEPDERYSAGQFGRDAAAALEGVKTRGNIPVVCGGTGLYIRALFDPLHELPQAGRNIKNEILDALKKSGFDHLYLRLKEIDPEWAQRINPRDRQRILRGLEVYEMTGVPLSTLLKGKKPKARYKPCYIGLQLTRPELYENIEKRFDTMIANGLIEEIRRLLKKGYDMESGGLKTIGYKEICEYLDGQISLDEAIAEAKQRTRNFAKRQLTWFRRLDRVHWFDARDQGVVSKIVALVQKSC
jgi:tRNA dimethylallyltransferase